MSYCISCNKPVEEITKKRDPLEIKPQPLVVWKCSNKDCEYYEKEVWASIQTHPTNTLMDLYKNDL